MAKAPATAQRVAVTITGNALLSAIAAGAVSRLTQTEAAEPLAAGHIEANTQDVDGFGAAAVRLSPAGVALLETPAAPTEANKRTPLAFDTGVAMPADIATRKRGPVEAVYPFETMPVGASFHVAKSDTNPDPLTRLSSSISGARARSRPVLTGEDGKPLSETVTVAVYAQDAAGKFVKDAAGKRIKTGERTETRPQYGEPTKNFRARAVDATDPSGAGVRCWRTE